MIGWPGEDSARLVAMLQWLKGFRQPWEGDDDLTEAEGLARIRATLERADDLVAAEPVTVAEFAAMVLVETRDGWRAVPDNFADRLRALAARAPAACVNDQAAIARLATELLAARNARGEVPDALVLRLRFLAGMIG